LCDHKLEKREIAKSIIKTIKELDPPGRFIELNRVTLDWEEIDENKAIIKTSQALREKRNNVARG